MKRISVLVATAIALLILGATLVAYNGVAQEAPTQTADVDRIQAAGREFIAAIAARDIRAMEQLWAHEPYATFIGPLSTSIVVGWDGVRKAWEMRFSQFDRVTISLAESHVYTNGKIGWAVGIEKVQLLRKDGKTLSLDAFVTNVYEERDGRWLVVSHQATPMFANAQVASTTAAIAQTASPYAGQEQRTIKALSDEEIQGLLEGRGIGLAKAAELNSYPGPLHVLQLADQLGLSEAQRKATDSLYATMREKAVALGHRLIEAERSLDQAFRDGQIDAATLRSHVNTIAILQGELRTVHLETHLAQRALLSGDQIATYDALRGYAGNAAPHAARKHGG